MLSRCCRRKEPHLALTGESHGLSRVAAGGLGFLCMYHQELRSLSCCLREVKSPFELQGCARECSGVTAGESGLNLHGRGNLKVFLELRQEVWVPSSYHGDLREPLMLSLGSQESFRVVRGLLGFLSSWCRRLGPHLDLRRETQGSSIRMVSSAYLRLLIFFPAILISACASSSLAFHMMYSTSKLNKQGDNIQP